MNDKGAEYLIDALKVNRVRQHLFLSISYSFAPFWQTLTTLLFESGGISDKGAIYLADAMLINQVRRELVSSIQYQHILEAMKISTARRKRDLPSPC